MPIVRRTLEPDLIIALYTDMDAQQYETLSAIAPTIAPSGEYPEFGMPWQETTRTVGLALGQPQRAEELIAEVDAMIAGARAAHPEFEGLRMVVAELFEPGSSFARSPNDPRTKLMTSLGFALPGEIAELAGDLDGAEISDERMDLLDRDLLVWNVGHDPELRAQIEASGCTPNSTWSRPVTRCSSRIHSCPPPLPGAPCSACPTPSTGWSR